MAKTSVLTILIQLAKKGDADRATIKGLAELKANAGLAMNAFTAFAGVAASGAAILMYFSKAAEESAKADAKLEAVLKSTAGAAGMSMTALDQLATAKSRQTGVDDELIKSAEAVMLTFTNIGKDAFPGALSAAMDMSAVLGGDLQSSVMQVSKAMNVTAGDTATASLAMTTLRKNGVSFTAEQKALALEMVRTGDIIGYQKLILSELNREFGGSAEKMNAASDGSSNLKNAWGNLSEAIGTGVLPGVRGFNSGLTELLEGITSNIQMSSDYNALIEQTASNMGVTVEQMYGMAQAADDNFASWDRWLSVTASENFRMSEHDTTSLTTAIEGNTNALGYNEEQIQATSQANTGMLDLIFKLQDENTRYSESLGEVNTKFEDAKYVQDLYKQSKTELLQQAQAGTITWREYGAQVASLSADYQNGTSAAQQQAQAVSALAAEHEKASQRIAFSLLQQKAAVDGLADAEFNSLLTVGKQWGILDDTTVQAAASMNAEMTSMAAAMEDPKNQLMAINSKWKNALDAPKTVGYTVTITTIGGVPNLNSPGTATSGANYNPYANQTNAPSSGANYNPYAHHDGGGQWQGGFAFVGEQGYEIITPTGYVIPHEMSKKLVEMGIAPAVGYAAGYSNMTSASAPSTMSMSQASNYSPAPQQQMMDRVVERIEKSNAELSDRLASIESIFVRQESTLKNALVAAMIQVRP